MSRIKVTIDRMVLKGFAPSDGNALANALQGELSRILGDRTTSAALGQSRRTPMLRLGQMPLEPGAQGGRKLGQGMAHAVGKGLKP